MSLKLYKNIDGQLHFWETWDIDDKTGAIHKGVVGQRGEYKKIKSGFRTNIPIIQTVYRTTKCL